jgi:hypothetical protein
MTFSRSLVAAMAAVALFPLTLLTVLRRGALRARDLRTLALDPFEIDLQLFERND